MYDGVATLDEAARELGTIADEYGSEALLATVATATGAVELSSGEKAAALRSPGRAWELWQSADCPFEAAQARRMLGLACRELGDEEGAESAIRWALGVFERLGAADELARTAEPLGARPAPAGLTAREVEVLRLVAAGKSNREIANQLYLSVKTVARHLSNIFCKIDVSSRTAAAAFAYEHGLVDEL